MQSFFILCKRSFSSVLEAATVVVVSCIYIVSLTSHIDIYSTKKLRKLCLMGYDKRSINFKTLGFHNSIT